MRIILLLITCCLIVSCIQTRTPPVQVTYGERQSLYFTGRGSAAGIMMDSVLGGADVAIGIAIDEGIAKDIESAIATNNPGFSMTAVVENVLHEHGKIEGLQSVIIDKYGFQAMPDDEVAPLIELQLIKNGGIVLKLKSSRDSTSSITFIQAKTEGALAEQQLSQEVKRLLTHAFP